MMVNCSNCGKRVCILAVYDVGISYLDIVSRNNIWIKDLQQNACFCRECKEEGEILARKLCECLTEHVKHKKDADILSDRRATI